MDEATRLLPRFYLGSAPTKNPGFTFIALCAKEWQPRAEILAPAKICRIPLEDVEEPISPRVQKQIEAGALALAQAWKREHKVLVSCIMGRNRSALVSALALMPITNLHPGDIAEQIRVARVDPFGVPALSNDVFWNFLQDY